MPEPQSVQSVGASGLEPVPSRPESLSIPKLLKESGRFYRLHWRAYTGALIPPALKIILSSYSCLALAALFTNEVDTRYREFFQENPWLLVGIMLGITTATMFWFFWGFWQYLVFMVTFNRNALDHLQGRSTDFRAAYAAFVREKRWPYKNLLGAYCVAALLMVPVILLLTIPCLLVSVAVMVTAGEAAGNLIFNITSTAASVLGCIPLFFLSYVFQLSAFQPLGLNPLPVMRQSCGLTRRAPWRTIGLQIALMLLTCLLIPYPLVKLARLIRLSLPLDLFHGWLLEVQLLSGLDPDASGWGELIPEYYQLYEQIKTMVPGMTTAMTDGFLMSVITLLLLPLGTVAFLLLYRELSADPNPENPAGSDA